MLINDHLVGPSSLFQNIRRWRAYHTVIQLLQYWASQVALVVKNPPANAENIWETPVQSLGWEDPLEKGMEIYSVYSCLENPMDRGALQSTVHGVTRVRHDLAIKPPLLDRWTEMHFPITICFVIVRIPNSSFTSLFQIFWKVIHNMQGFVLFFFFSPNDSSQLLPQ